MHQPDSFQALLFSPYRTPAFFYCLWILLWVNDSLIKSRFLENKLWDFLKWELFYIGGECRQCGSCCSGIMLYWKGHRVCSESEFQKLALQYPQKFSRFQYQLDSQGITAFDCICLTSDHRCSDYHNRPEICRHYPVNLFLQAEMVPLQCGYYLKRTILAPNLKYPARIRSLMNEAQL